MKKLWLFCLLLVLCTRAQATHIFGGELLYTYVSGNTYTLKLTIYGDCSGAAFPSLDTSNPQINIFKEGVYLYNIALSKIDDGVEVSPVCPDQLFNTTCHGGTLPGVKRYIYEANIDIDSTGNWDFIFFGHMNSSQNNGAGRSNAITNIVFSSPNGGGASSIIELRAYLNNTLGNNSSPQYTTIPTPFYCINTQEQYNQGATDPNGDALVYHLVPAYDGNTGDPVSYINPYSATYPLSTASGAFVFDTVSGQMTFTPNLVQDAVVDDEVLEYRNGVLVGASVREMTFIVSADCNDNPPTANVNPASVVGGGVAAGNIINVCQGTPNVSFTINVADADTDVVNLTTNNIPSGANITVNNNGTTSPTINFSWNTASVAPGIYYFYVGLKDTHCPVSSSPTIAFIINITSLNQVTDSVLFPTGCIGKAEVAYYLSGGTPPRVFTVTRNGSFYETFTDSANVVYDSLPSGDYVVSVNSYALNCPTNISFGIIDSGMFTLPPYNAAYCIEDSTVQLDIAPIRDSATMTWATLEGNILSVAPTIFLGNAGSQRYILTEHYKVCNSYPDTVTATVHNLPDIKIANVAETPCYGDKIDLIATGGVTYTWLPADAVKQDDSGHVYYEALTPATLTVTGVDVFGCSNNDSIAYTNITPCCLFSYPNAFTPNKDGRNDKYFIVTYGNMQSFYLNIYNRWGERVFNTFDQYTGWDGTYHGQPCEVGTYFFYMKAKCLTGREEIKSGTITLVR